MKHTTKMTLLATSLLIWGCGGGNNEDNNTSNGGDSAVGAAVRVDVVEAGDDCEAGGLAIVTGLDTNGNGALDESEETDTKLVCNGADGSDGEDGEAGTPGADGADGSDGEAGTPGADGSDGADGMNGQDGFSTLVNLTEETPGAECPQGGQRVDVGLDNGDGGATARDGVLQLEEVDQSSFVCNGADAPVNLVVPRDASAAACPNGGFGLDIGLDNGDGGGTANNGTLEPDEIDASRDVCNGAAGADGADGADGQNGADGADGADGQNGADGQDGADGQNGVTSLVNISAAPANLCANGGQLIETGLDNGDGNGTANNGTLEADEVDATSAVCNGTNGLNGQDGADGQDGAPGQDGQDGAPGQDGQDGAPGQDGANGFSTLVNLVTINPNIACPNGGQRIDVGLDNGDGNGTARDGVLSSGEVDTTRNVCNGANGADGQDGADGQNGADGADGGAQIVVDANGRNLGKLVSLSASGVTLLTPNNYYYSVAWDGDFFTSQIWYSDASCSVGPVLNSGSATPRQTYAAFLVWDEQRGTFAQTANPDANGFSTSGSFGPAGSIQYSDGSCSTSSNSNRNGWPLNDISFAAAGIPTTITPPLTVQ